MLLYPKRQPFEAWQFGQSTPAPLWVRRCTERRNGELFHVRQSGAQIIMSGSGLFAILTAAWCSTPTRRSGRSLRIDSPSRFVIQDP